MCGFYGTNQIKSFNVENNQLSLIPNFVEPNIKLFD